jgi:hypothetical protein
VMSSFPSMRMSLSVIMYVIQNNCALLISVVSSLYR